MADVVAAVVQFYADDPKVAWLLTVGLLFAIGAIWMAIHHARQERRQRQWQELDERMRRKLHAIMPAPPEPISWPPPSGPKGLKNKFPRNAA